MLEIMVKYAAFVIAAILELGGCYLMWMGQRQSSAVLWIFGIAALAGFGFVLAQVSDNLPSRAYAAYGGIYIAAAFMWMVVVDKNAPDKWDIVGVSLTLAGATVILLGSQS
jgi:small multidrug resistance family-3 protein